MNAPVTVQCRAEHSYPGRPLRFTWGDTEYEAEQVLHAWREPDAHCFLVATPTGIAELAYLPAPDQWVLRQFSPVP